MSDVTYDVAVWQGSRPADPADAMGEFKRRRAHVRQQREPASAEIAGFVADLLDQYPEDNPDDLDDDSPWATGPLIDEASGDFMYFAMTFSGARLAYDDVVRTAQRHNLVCFDPQTSELH